MLFDRYCFLFHLYQRYFCHRLHRLTEDNVYCIQRQNSLAVPFLQAYFVFWKTVSSAWKILLNNLLSIFLKNALRVPLSPESNLNTVRLWPSFYRMILQRYLVILIFTLTQIRNVNEVVVTVITNDCTKPSAVWFQDHISTLVFLVSQTFEDIQICWLQDQSTDVHSSW